MGFMFLEIALIQKLTLFLGYPTYSLTVTLFALLLFTGLGSLASARWGARRDRSVIVLFVATAALSLAYQAGLGPLVTHLGGAPLGVRIVVAVVLLAPLGLCLGAFMPLGLLTVSRLSPHAPEFVAWGWAVNGFASVVSSILAVILSMVIGFNAVLTLAIAFYLLAALTLIALPDGPRARPEPV
jgi:MFS family permease